LPALAVVLVTVAADEAERLGARKVAQVEARWTSASEAAIATVQDLILTVREFGQ
jgi:hypothetical protein